MIVLLFPLTKLILLFLLSLAETKGLILPLDRVLPLLVVCVEVRDLSGTGYDFGLVTGHTLVSHFVVLDTFEHGL